MLLRKALLSVILLPLFSGLVCASDYLNLKFGLDMKGTNEYEAEGFGDYDVEQSFSLGGEYERPLNDNISGGAGLLYQFSRSEEFASFSLGEFNFLPLYGLLKVYANSTEINPFFLAHLGYGLLTADSTFKGDGGSVDGGIYYAFGGGLHFKNGFIIELLYSVNNGTLDHKTTYYDFFLDEFVTETDNSDFNYKHIAINFGYKFAL